MIFLAPLHAFGVEVITHRSVALEELSTAQLRRIYLMRQVRWPDQSPIVVFILPSQHQTHKTFAQTKLNLLPYKLDRIWNKLTFSGLGVAPKLVNSEAELLEAVKSTPGAIGYVDSVTKEDKVNVVKISS